MRKTTRYCLIAVALICLLWLTACERVLSDAERATVLVSSEVSTDNLMAGLQASDYAVFSRDLDADMRKQISASDFATWKRDLDNQFGKYLSRTVERVTRADEFYVVTYRARFELEDLVTVTVAFHSAKPEMIAFLAYDSKKASWSAFQQKR